MSKVLQPLPEVAMGGNFWTPHGTGSGGKSTLGAAATDTHDFPGDSTFIPEQVFVANVGANPAVVTWNSREFEVASGKNIRLAGRSRQLTITSALGTDYILAVSDSALPQMNLAAN